MVKDRFSNGARFKRQARRVESRNHAIYARSSPTADGNQALEDALQALIALGYKEKMRKK